MLFGNQTFCCPAFSFVVDQFEIVKFFLGNVRASTGTFLEVFVFPAPRQVIIFGCPTFTDVKSFFHFMRTHTNGINSVVIKIPSGGGIDQGSDRRPGTSPVRFASKAAADKLAEGSVS